MQERRLKDGDGRLVTNTETLRNTWSQVCDLKRREMEAKRQRVAARERPTNDPPPLASEAPDA